MVPTIANNGTSFRGASSYYLHDKDASTRERIAWTHTENLPTDDPDQAWKLMAWTALNQAELKRAAGVRGTGRKLEKPVFAFSVSWHPEEKPTQAEMIAAANSAAAILGLADHQAVYVSHNDEPHPHVHVLANRVHPRTGKVATLSHGKQKLAAWALEYEKERGKVYCPGRERNARRRQERLPGREAHPGIEAAWREGKSGRAFQDALRAQGFELAQGNRRFVVVDRWGKAHNPVRQLPGVKTREFIARLGDIDLNSLPTAAYLQRAVRASERKQYHAARRFDKWAATYLNQQQDRQLEERGSLFNRYAHTLEAKKIELAKFYKLDEQNARIAVLQKRVDHPSLWRRLTGGARKDREALVVQRDQLSDSEHRMAEQLGAIAKERDLAQTDLAERHAREKELAQEHIAERKPAFYREERANEQERSGRGPNRSRDDDRGREYVQYHHLPNRPSPL